MLQGIKSKQYASDMNIFQENKDYKIMQPAVLISGTKIVQIKKN
jgi:hypothetical protein